MSVEIKLRKSEPLEKALRRLKKKLDREGVLRDVKAKRFGGSSYWIVISSGEIRAG